MCYPDLQLELEDVLLLCGRPTAGPASTSNGTAVPNTSTTGASSRTASTGSVLEPPRRQQMRSDNAGSYADAAPTPSTARLDYLLFLALMAWLDHKPERQQYQQQLLDCVDFDRMTNVELSQVGMWLAWEHGRAVTAVFVVCDVEAFKAGAWCVAKFRRTCEASSSSDRSGA